MIKLNILFIILFNIIKNKFKTYDWIDEISHIENEKKINNVY